MLRRDVAGPLCTSAKGRPCTKRRAPEVVGAYASSAERSISTKWGSSGSKIRAKRSPPRARAAPRAPFRACARAPSLRRARALKAASAPPPRHERFGGQLRWAPGKTPRGRGRGPMPAAAAAAPPDDDYLMQQALLAQQGGQLGVAGLSNHATVDQGDGLDAYGNPVEGAVATSSTALVDQPIDDIEIQNDPRALPLQRVSSVADAAIVLEMRDASIMLPQWPATAVSAQAAPLPSPTWRRLAGKAHHGRAHQSGDAASRSRRLADKALPARLCREPRPPRARTRGRLGAFDRQRVRTAGCAQ